MAKVIESVVYLLTVIVTIRCHDTIKMTIPESEIANRTPVILIPGDGGSRIYARYNGTSLFCPVRKEWFRIWLNLEFLLPITEHCLPEFFRLNYNRTTRRTTNQPGVESKIFHWGDTQGVETLDDSGYSYSYYYFKLAEALRQVGYTSNVDLRGAPYDFRKAPNDNDDFIPNMKTLIEETYYINGQRRVMLIAHSLGNIYALYFLRLMPKAWKKRYIRGYVAVAAPIAGATKPLRLMTSGITLGEPIFFQSYMRDVGRTMSSTPLLFPSHQFWDSNEVLVSRPGKNYTVNDYEQLFKDIGYPDGWEMFKDAHRNFDPAWVPDVDELVCLYGSGHQTPGALKWLSDKEFPNFTPNIEFEAGDGTVNARSLRACRRWPGVKVEEINGSEHLSIISDHRFLLAITRLLQQPDKHANTP